MWQGLNPRSLRSRIVLLALFACLLLCAAGTSFFFFLNSSQKAKLDTAQKHLIVLAGAMRSDYLSQRSNGFSLNQVQTSLPPHPPPVPMEAAPPIPPPPSTRLPHPPPPLAPLGDKQLSQVTTAVLRRESDVEGGFYSAKSGVLVGYAFPTHLGPGGQSEIPEKEKPNIEDLVRKAVDSGTLEKQSFHGDYDAILFVAAPIIEKGQTTGSVWLMQRMPGLEAGRSKQLLLGSLGFTAAAIACALLTFFVMSEVNTGVYAVLDRLSSMEGALGEHDAAGAKPQLTEFQTVLERVDALSDSLKQKIETQRALEDEIRHRQRLSALGQFAAGVAHELRNPLATIQLRTQMSKRPQDQSTVERNCDVVLDEVTRLNTMIERLLYFSRPIHLQLKPVSIGHLCHQCEESWGPRFAEQHVQFSCRAGDELIAFCDVGTIRQVLDNLLDNALQSVLSSSSDPRQISLQGKEVDGSVSIEVSDNGGGMKQGAETHALEPFFTTKETGTGLGLSISYEIAQAHGGDLYVRNRAGGGAVATIILPQPGGSAFSSPTLRSQEDHS